MENGWEYYLLGSNLFFKLSIYFSGCVGDILYVNVNSIQF